jgi:Zn-finger nucleic acid-binding protein
MVKARFGGERGQLIDRCVNGHGIWLDKGELEEIAAGGDRTDRIRKFLAGIFAVEKASRNKSSREGEIK